MCVKKTYTGMSNNYVFRIRRSEDLEVTVRADDQAAAEGFAQEFADFGNAPNVEVLTHDESLDVDYVGSDEEE